MRSKLYKQRYLSILLLILITAFGVTANNVVASKVDGTKNIETKNGESLQTHTGFPRAFNGKSVPQKSTNPKLAPANFELVMATTGNGFENDTAQHPYGIKSDWVQRIDAFQYSWGWGITGINLLIPWERFEPTPGNYQLATLQKVINFCDQRGLTLSIKFLAQRSESDGFLLPSEYVKGYFKDQTTGNVISEVFSTVNIPGSRDVYPSYGCDRTNAMIFNAVKKIAEKLNTYSRAGVMSLAGGTTEELANHIFDYSGVRLAGDFSDDNMSRFNQWVTSRGLATPGTPVLDNGTWPAPKFDTPLGVEFGRFMSYNIGKYQRNFVNAVKSVSNIPVIYVYAAASNSQLKSTANANMNYIAATSDGMYGSEGDGVQDHVAKFRVNSVNLGTKPNGISCVEFDPDDWSRWRYRAHPEKPPGWAPSTPDYCDNDFDYAIVKNSMESLYSKGVRYINLTMGFCPAEIQGMSSTLQQLRQSYVGKPYVRPTINSSNTVTVEVTQKYRAGQDLTDGIDVYNQYTKYTDNDFWGGISPDGCSTPSPTLIATSTNIQPGQTVTITASGCTGTLNWQNGVGSGSSITVSPTTTTTYFVSCTANGCTSATASITINVSCPSPSAPSLSATSTSITSGQSVTLSASGCSGGTITWSHGLGSGSSKTVTPTSPTTYTATCTLNGCTSSPASITINVSQPSGINCNTMQSDFGAADCNNLNGWIYDQSNPNTVINVDIYEGSTLIAGNIAAGNFRQDLLDAGKGNGYHGFVIPTPAALKNGQNRSISMRATGCSYVLSGSPRTINCQGCTAPSAPSLSATSTSITSGQSVTLSASGCSGGTITWSHGLGSGSSKTVTPTSPTTYTATCTLNGCTSSPASITINVSQPSGINCNTMQSDFGGADCNNLNGWIYDQSNPNTVINVDIYEGSTLIAGNIAAGNFRQDLLDAGKGNGYHGFVIPTPAALKNGQNRSISMRATGCSYVLSGSPRTINCQGCTAPSAPSLSATSTSITSGQSVTLSASGCSGGTITWSHGLGSGSSKTVTPTSPTTYTATCTLNGCTSSPASITINVSQPSGINCNTLESDFGSASCSVLSGWVYDQSNPNTVVNFDIYEGSTLIAGNIPAGNFRQDLLNAGKGNGYHGFQIETPSQLKNGQNRTLTLKASGCSYVFTNSPRTINCAPGSRLAAAEENSSVRDETSLKITVAPNPNSGSFEISFYQVSKKASLSIVDKMGSIRFKREVTGRGEHRMKVDLTNVPSGTYHVVLDQYNQKKSKKIVIIK